MGRPSAQDSQLVSKIAKKIGKSELEVRKAASALGRRKKVPLDVALIYYGEDHGVGTGDAQRRLDSGKIIILDRILNGSASAPAVSNGARQRKSIKTPSTDWSEYTDPNLGESLYSSVPVEAYGILFILENSIRNFISRILVTKFGNDWWVHIQEIKSLSEMIGKINNRKSTESGNWYHAKRGAHEIYYADYAELLRIIRVCDSTFSVYFKKGAAKNLIGKLEELTPTRNVIAHNNPITKTDFDRLKIHAHDWFAYMQNLRVKIN